MRVYIINCVAVAALAGARHAQLTGSPLYPISYPMHAQWVVHKDGREMPLAPCLVLHTCLPVFVEALATVAADTSARF